MRKLMLRSRVFMLLKLRRALRSGVLPQGVALVRRVILVAASLAVMSGGGPVHALLLDGQTIETTLEFPTLGNIVEGPYLSVVGPSVELQNLGLGFGVDLNVDFADTTITVTFNNLFSLGAASFNGLHFFDVSGTISDFTNVTIDSATNLAGFDASRVSFDGDNIFLNASGLSYDPTSLVKVNVVPEPSTMLLLGMGLAGLLVSRRPRR